MPELLAAFAPRLCVEAGLLERGGSTQRDATVLFVDLAGFTPLTDRLGAVGSRGTEELSHLLRGFFGAVTDAVLERGGDPVAYGGDALTIVYDGPPNRTVRAALESAQTIQRLARATAGSPTAAGPVTLQARIGVARGPVTSAVAAATHRSIPVHLGAGLDRAVAAEGNACAGQVVLDPEAEGSLLPNRHSEPASRPSPERVASTSALARLVHPVTLGRLTEGRALLESHRSITVAFAHFPAVGSGELAAFLRTVGRLLELVDGLDGELVQVSGGDKGVVAMVVFGAPVAHSDDPLRSVQAMLELRRRQPSTAVGIATGPVFAALLGSERRRFAAHSGQVVNIAARLMQAATPGQVLVENTTWRATSGHLRHDGRPVLRSVKGREEPVETHRVASWRRGQRRVAAPADPPLVGRQIELEAIERLLDDLAAGTGHHLLLVGEPGIGKSRLVRESLQRATTRGIEVVAVDSDDHPWGRSAPLWRDLVGGVTGIPVGARRHQWLDAFTSYLPDAAAQVPLLGELIGVSHSDSRTPETVQPDLRVELMMALLGRLFVAAATQRPYLVVVENADHLDQGSQALLDELGRAMPGSRAGLLVTRRTGGSRTSDPINGERLLVGQLSRTHSALLAQDVWRQSGGGSPPPWLPDAVRRRADGNPLFVRTVTNFLYEHWEPGQPPPSEDFATESLGGLLAERVDRLPAAAHQLLNVLAVARQPCPLTVAAGLLPEPFDDNKAASAATMLVTEGLVHLDTSVAEGRYRLAHEVLQQVVYQAISHAERGRLHRLLATRLSKAGADPIEVAEHVVRLDDQRLARRWFPRAADSARASWNLPVAVEWWQRALPLLSGLARVAAEVELLELLLIVGRANEVLALADDINPAGDTRPAHEGSGPSVALTARRMHAVAEAALVCGNLDRSESAAVETMRLTDERDEPRHQRAAELLVLVRCARGDLRAGTATAQAQLDRAVRSGNLRAVTTAQASLGAALLHAGMPDSAAPHYEQALVGAVALGDVIQQIHVLSDLAGCAFETGRYADSVDLLGRARESADRIGYRRHLAFNLSNEAQLRAALGDPHSATCAAAAMQRSLEMGDLTAAANALHTWVTSEASVSADPNRWRRLRAIDTLLGRRSVAAADAADQALAAARCGRTDNALRVANEAIKEAQETDQAPVLRRAALARLVAELRQTTATDPLTQTALLTELQSLAAAEDLSDVEAAELSLERWRVTGTDPDRGRAADLALLAFATEPSATVRRWLSELGAPVPAPPTSLPPPVGIGRARSTRKQLDDAFRRLETALSETRSH